MLRFDPSIQIAFRTALRDVALAGFTIPRGHEVHVLIGAANRDPAHFPEPDRFDLSPAPRTHSPFARGPITASGAALQGASYWT